MKKDLTLTSVKIPNYLWEEFRVASIKQKFTFQKLATRAIHLYLTDPEFRKMLHNHVNVNEITE